MLVTKIIAHLKEKGHEVVDFGTRSAQSTDYPPEVLVQCSHPIPAPVAGQILVMIESLTHPAAQTLLDK